jgi:ABC-2 type transport system ATP-binding protein
MEFLSVEQVLRLVSECRGEPSTAEAERLMRALDLNKCRGQKLSLLSGGQRRKVSLAASLIGSRVRLMILDEPTAGALLLGEIEFVLNQM